MFSVASIGALVTAIAALGRSDEHPLAEQGGSGAPTELAQLVAVDARGFDSVRATYDRGTRLLEGYLRRPIARQAASATEAVRLSSEPCHTLQVLVATLPDPFDSHLDWGFDAYLESLRRAFATAGYVPDRFWLPRRGDSLRITTPQRAAVTASMRDYYPGVLLFRGRDPNQRRLALLYVVNELPTSGVNKEALLAAVRERRTLLDDVSTFCRDSSGVRARETLSVIGPIFSGSSTSLRRALDDALTFVDISPRHAVDVVTGSATGFQNRRTLSDSSWVVRATSDSTRCRSARGATGKTGSCQDSVQRISFRATTNSDEAMSVVLDSVLRVLSIARDKVVVLSESSTQYGENRAPGDAGGYLTIPFPLNMASLRGAVRNGAGGDALGMIPGLSEGPRTALNLAEQGQRSEAPGVTSVLTVPTVDLVMDEIMHLVRDRGIQAVIIQATDIRDKMMLASEVKRRARDTQLILFESHRLLLRPEYAQFLRGALVVTSYPLFMGNQWWTRRGTDAQKSDPSELLAFGNDAASGTYNAALTLLGYGSSRMEYELPYAPGGNRLSPPIWLTTVGNGGFFPVAVFEGAPQYRAYTGGDREPSRGAHSDAGFEGGSVLDSPRTLAIFLLGAFLMLVSFWVLARRPAVPRKLGSNATDRQVTYREIESASLVIHERIYATLLVIALCGVYFPAGVTLAYTRQSSAMTIQNALLATLAGFVIVLGIVDVVRLLRLHGSAGWAFAMDSPRWEEDAPAALLTTNERRYRGLRMGRRRQSLWLVEVFGRGCVALIGLAYLVVLAWWVWSIVRLAGAESRQGFTLFSYRALEYFSGVSPVTVTMLLGFGFALWSLWHWRQADYLRDRITACEEAALSACERTQERAVDQRAPASVAVHPFVRAAGAVARVRDTFFRLLPNESGVLLTILVALIAMVVLPQRVGLFERLVLPNAARTFDILFRIGIYSLLVTTAWAAYRLTITWGALQDVLDIVGETPLLNAFHRLPRHIARLTRLTMLASPPREGAQATAEELYRALRARVPSLVDDVKASAPAPVAGGPPLAPKPPTPPGASPTAASAALDQQVATDVHRLLAEPLTNSGDSHTKARAKLLEAIGGALTSAWRVTGATPAREGERPREVVRLTAAADAVVRLSEELLAVEFVQYLESVLHNVRRLAGFLLGSMLLAVLTLSSYPFHPQGLVKLVFLALLLWAVGSLFLVMTQMSKHDVLSSIARTEPGKVTWDTTFVLNGILFGAVPLLAVATAEFPGVRTFLFSWAQPITKSMFGG